MRTSIEDAVLMNQIEQMFLWSISTSEIGAALGYTKNQIVGLVHRGRNHGYNFPLRDNKYWRTQAKKGMRLSSIAKHKMKENQNKSRKVKEAQYKPVKLYNGPIAYALEDLYFTKDIKEIPLEGLPLLQVPANGCKYPIGQNEQTHLFCSQPKTQGSYCDKHYKLMFNPHTRHNY